MSFLFLCLECSALAELGLCYSVRKLLVRLGLCLCTHWTLKFSLRPYDTTYGGRGGVTVILLYYDYSTVWSTFPSLPKNSIVGSKVDPTFFSLSCMCPLPTFGPWKNWRISPAISLIFPLSLSVLGRKEGERERGQEKVCRLLLSHARGHAVLERG